MLRFRSLSSGSTGNATLVEVKSGAHTVRLLVDCGLGIRQLGQRLAGAGLALGDLDGIFITHEHADHIGCTHALALRERLPVWMSHGTYTAIGAPDFEGLLHIAHDSQDIELGPLRIVPFTVPHDAQEPLQISCSDGARHLGILTDLGHATPHVLAHLVHCHALLLESNHDTDMLQASAYPPFLQKRIAGRYGHLANAQAADIARQLRHPGLHCLVAAHLSQKNNQPALAQAALAHAMEWEPAQIMVADPQQGTDWLQV